MGISKEYADRAVQTDVDAVPSPYADPAVVLAALPVTRRERVQEAHGGRYNLVAASSPSVSDSPCALPQTPVSPIFAPPPSRRLSKRKHPRYPAGGIVNRRIASMPENKSDSSYISPHDYGKRVVSMPDRVRPLLEPSAELLQSPSAAAGDSFESYSGRRERVRVFYPPSDVPQTPSPPSSPESLLIIAAGTQLPEDFLRRKYSPEPLIEEDEDWIAWANSPPRPIPALHGPLSLPYARCPSGAEGTIIEEPDSVAQMIWGLSPDDQAHIQTRAEGSSSHFVSPQHPPLHEFNQAPPRLQKKRTPTVQQIPKLSRTRSSAHLGHAKQSFFRTCRQAHDEERISLNQISPNIKTHQNVMDGAPWNEEQSMPNSVGIPNNLVDEEEEFPVDNSSILEWQLARLQQALRTSLADAESYNTYPGRLEPVIPLTTVPGISQSYPRIFVEPRPNESINSASRQSPIEMAQQYRQQQQLFRQALQKQKLQAQNFLPTPPNSSSPQWSSHFSPYLTYRSTFSPELVGSTEHPIPVPSQKYRSGTDASQYPRRVYDRHEHDDSNNFDPSTNIPFAKIPQIVPSINPTASLRQSSSPSSTLAKYIKQLQALSPIARFLPLQPMPPLNVSLPLPSTDDATISSSQSVHHSPAAPTPPSPESPQTTSRAPSYNSHLIPPTRPMQRRLSSVPEEDSALLELSTSVSPPRLQDRVMIDRITSNHDVTKGHQIRYCEVPFVDGKRTSIVPDLHELESNLGTPSIAFHQDTSPVKVRLPAIKEHDVREQTSGHHERNNGHQHGHRKKHRHRKLKGVTTNESALVRGPVG